MIRKYSIRNKLTLSILLLSSLSFAQELYTVDQLVLKALDLSPDLHISSYQYKASQSRYDEAFSAYLPNINLRGGAGTSGTSGILVKPDETRNATLMLGQLSVQQLVYDFGKTGGYSDSAKLESGAYLSNYEQLISDKKKDVKGAYYDVLKAKSLIEVNIENVKLNESQLYRSKKYFEAGIRTKIDVTDAKVELIKSQLELNDSNYNLKLAYANLDKTIGYMKADRDYKVFYTVFDTKTVDVNLREYPLNLIDAIKYAYENRYIIKKHQELILASMSIENVTSSEYYPQLYINAEYTKQKIGDELINYVPETKYSAMLNLDWNLYEGGASSARNQAQKVQTSISTSELLFSKLTVKTEVTNAYINLNSVKDSVILSKSLLDASKEKFEQAGQRYEHGLSDYIELQQARQGYIDASASLVNNYYNYFDAIAILDNAIGK